ncbi:MAG TPA: hypothetical protein VG248_13885 [Caulobacteraceae bacterium]|jgi:hypothetical protein|nr:hypothetical protein [Caulobacteraceae bacterium]
MNGAINNVKLLLVGMFFLASAVTIGYQAWYIWPMQKCERGGDWWDGKDHQCLAPIPVWRITGRLPPIPASPGKAAAKAPANG